jgi:hypothetical protein
MSNEIVAVSIQDAATQLRDKIHSAFAEIIPPEQWNKLIEAQLLKFLNPTRERDNYDRYTERPALIETICREEFTKHARALVSKELQKPEYQADYGQGKVGDFVKKWMTEHADELVRASILALAGNAAQALIEDMRNRHGV